MQNVTDKNGLMPLVTLPTQLFFFLALYMTVLEVFFKPLLNFFVRNRKVRIVVQPEVIMQGKLFQRYTHLLHCTVLSLVGNVNTRRMSKPDMGSIFHIKNQ